MTDFSAMKLGKLPPKYDRHIPLFSAFTDNLPPPPDSVDWSKGRTDWGEMGNTTLGDCTAAGIGHAYQTWTQNARTLWTPSDQMIVDFYSATTGYNPADPATDQGGVETDVLAWLLKNGFDNGKRHIEGYCSVNTKNLVHVKQSIDLLGGSYIGISLPISAQTQSVWDVPAHGTAGSGMPGSWGGHCVFVVGYDEQGLTCVTWGSLMRMTWPFWTAYVDEAHPILAAAWVMNSQRSPSGFPYAELCEAMNEIIG
jgi:hypothetical protein